ncbi:MAG: GTP pyrophosphokinase [Janthinobacterium lividum]
MKESILDDYKKNKKTYHAYRERIINLLNDLLSTESIVVHQLVGRTKSLESLSKKIDDKNSKYSSINDITDIVGIRIITYLESDINSIAELIEKEFIKDLENSVDKRKLQADRFGYKSLHVVVSLNDSRTNLKEYKRYKELKCEIQIRSILQHAWAEIEHDLGYKGEISVPDQYKRSFNRVSALLETADNEFDRLKSELTKYEKEVSSLIKTEPEYVDINQASLASFINSNPTLVSAKNLIEQKTSNQLTSEEVLSDTFIKSIKFFKFNNIGEIEKALLDCRDNYLNFVEFYLNDNEIFNSNFKSAWRAPLTYFLHFLATRTQDKNNIINYFIESNYEQKDIEYYFDLYERFQNNIK